MDDAQQHLDVDQIFERARQIDAGVHLVTVYRTIELLKKERLIDELDLLHLRGDRHYYETHGPRELSRTSTKPRMNVIARSRAAFRNNGGRREDAARSSSSITVGSFLEKPADGAGKR